MTSSARQLRALLVEDSEEDAELLVRELHRGGYELVYERVETASAMRAALPGQWDIVLSDYTLPTFSGPQAIAVLNEVGVDLPLIVVSGTVGEETAVSALRAGARDFIVKGKFARLLPAIERELREAKLREDRRTMQHQLSISERMASVGMLAAGVAHEVNNPLAAVIANLDVVRSLTASVANTESYTSDQLHELVDAANDAREAAERIRTIVRDLKRLSRDGDEESTEAVDVRRSVEASLRLASIEIRHRARVIKEYGDVPPIEANESRLIQVILNLLINAAQAMPAERTEQNEIRVTTGPRGSDRVVIEVRDNGVGIPPEHLPHIFDAFFTTKPRGLGTGLGLAICHRIVTSLHGEITVHSEIGTGTAFQVVLPIAHRAAADAQEPSAPPHSGVRARILLVDDDPIVCAGLRRVLGREHDLVVFTSARKALAHLREQADYDAILCDLMMPDMNGMELYTELERVDPEEAHRVVFMTGGAFTADARAFLEDVPNARLEKPFNPQDLRRVLDAVGHRAVDSGHR